MTVNDMIELLQLIKGSNGGDLEVYATVGKAKNMLFSPTYVVFSPGDGYWTTDKVVIGRTDHSDG